MTKFTNWDAQPRADLINKAVFLDRDGIINKARVMEGKPYPPRCVSEMELSPDIIEVCNQLKAAGYLLIIVTNQPDVSRGTQTQHHIEEMHDWIKTMLPIDAIFVCYHDDDDKCDCRKPKTGMLIKARNVFKLDIEKCFIIGDTWRDTKLGDYSSCKTILVDYNYINMPECHADFTCASVKEAANWILSQ